MAGHGDHRGADDPRLPAPPAPVHRGPHRRGRQGRRLTGVSTVRRGRHFLERDGRPILPVGAHYVPVEGPDWPWRVGAGGVRAGVRGDGRGRARHGPDRPPVGGDRARSPAATTRRTWASSTRSWRPPGGTACSSTRRCSSAARSATPTGTCPWRAGRHPHRDPELVALQAAQAAMLARRWRDDPAILAWDLTDEPPLWLFPDTTDAEAAAWTGALADALRADDPDHLVTIGTASQEVGCGPVPGGRRRRPARLRDRPPVPDLLARALPGRPARAPG